MDSFSLPRKQGDGCKWRRDYGRKRQGEYGRAVGDFHTSTLRRQSPDRNRKHKEDSEGQRNRKERARGWRIKKPCFSGMVGLGDGKVCHHGTSTGVCESNRCIPLPTPLPHHVCCPMKQPEATDRPRTVRGQEENLPGQQICMS